MATELTRGEMGRLLIVDDEPELMTVLCEMLSKQGFHTIGFESGEEALDFLKKEDIDILVSDMMMPGMDGITLLRESLVIDPHLVVVIMTGQATIQTAVEAMKSGAFDYIMKPFKLKDILAVLRRGLEVRHLRLDNIQLKESLALYELSQSISYPLDMKSMIYKTADAALHQCGADEVSIMLPLDEERNTLYVVAARGEHAERVLGAHIDMEKSIAGWVARNREPLILNGKVSDNRFRPAHARPDIVSSLSMPMLARGELVGVLSLNITRSRRNFTYGELKALTILIGLIAPILEGSWLYKKMKDAEKKYRSIFENAVEGIYQVSQDGRFLVANPGFVEILGYDSPESLVEDIRDLKYQYHVDPERYEHFRELIDRQGEAKAFEYQAYRRDGSKIWLSDNARSVRQNGVYCEGFVKDITKSKIVGERQKLAIRVLDVLNRQDGLQTSVRQVLRLLKDHTGIEVIAIRLREGDDYPYYQAEGLPEHSAKDGNCLCRHDDSGRMVHDAEGNAALTCLCGKVLGSLADASCPFFTEGGSFWTNNLSELPASIPEITSEAGIKPWCMDEGYESMALVPLHAGDGIVGLIQFADHARNVFTTERIRFFEGLGASIGIAVARQRADSALKESEERYHVAIESANDGVAILAEGKCVFVNRKCLEMFGYKKTGDLVGKEHSVLVHPDDQHLLMKYRARKGRGEPIPGRVEFKGLTASNETIYLEASPARITYGGRECVLVYLRDVTERKHAEEDLRNTLEKLKATLGATIEAMAAAVEVRDPYTAGHQRRVASLARAIAQEMGLSRESVEGLMAASIIHDIGKISVPAEILAKPTRLTSVEFDMIKGHPETGYNILKDIDFPWPVADIIFQHHEKLDGSGYPRKLSDEQILSETRILTVADVVEAMASHRPYRPSLGIDAALEEICRNRGILYQSEVVDACVRLFREKGFVLE